MCAPKTGKCAMTNIREGQTCDADGNPCTAGDICAAGVCKKGTNNCKCEQNADCGKFEDGNLCNGTLFCDKSLKPLVCEVNPKTVVSCPPGLDHICAENKCAKKTGKCAMTPVNQGVGCEADDNVCTADDRCDNGKCKLSQDTCGCQKDADCAAQEDGNVCNGTLYCDLTAKKCKVAPKTIKDCSTPTGSPCTVRACDAKKGCVVNNKENNSPCNDGNACTAADICTAGVCKGINQCTCTTHDDCAKLATPNACEGLLRCLQVGGFKKCVVDPTTKVTCPKPVDSCAKVRCTPKGTAAECVTLASGATTCDDGDVCTLVDKCEGAVCKGAKTPQKSCNDGNVCTVDECKAHKGCQFYKLDGKKKECADPNDDLCKWRECNIGVCSWVTDDCDDDNECTKEACTDGKKGCEYDPVAATTPCTDAGYKGKCDGAGKCIVD